MSQIARFTWPTWGPPGPCRPQVGHMLALWTLLSGVPYLHSLELFVRLWTGDLAEHSNYQGFFFINVVLLMNTDHRVDSPLRERLKEVRFKVASSFQNFTNFQTHWCAYLLINDRVTIWKMLSQTSNISVGIHVGSSLVKMEDTHLMNNNQPMAEILCWGVGKCIIYILYNVSSHWLSVMPTLIGQIQLCIWVMSIIL